MNQTGLSLIEILVATGLLGLALLPVAYVQSSGTRSGVASHELVAASALAVELIETVRNVPYADARVAATAGYVTPDATLSNANPLAANGTTLTGCYGPCGFTRTWKITNNAPITNAKRIDVQVSWSEYGVARSFVVSTIKAVGS